MTWGLTGTPGTGKTTVADRLATEVTSLGPLLEEPEYRDGYDEDRDTIVADVDALGEYVESLPGAAVVESHLVHLLPVDRVIVLRCHPDELDDRLRGREDSHPGGVDENVEAERLDVILGEAVDRHGPDAVDEIDTTDTSPATVAEQVARIIAGERRHPPGTVNFLSEQ